MGVEGTSVIRWLFRTSTLQADLGLLVARLAFGLTIALGHGLDKVSNFERFNGQVEALGIPAPQVLGTLGGLAEFLGGLLLAVGFLSRGAAAAIATTMAVAAFWVHADHPLICTRLPCQELAICYGAAALALFLAGPGRISVDHVLIGRRGAKRSDPAPASPPARGAAKPGPGAGPKAQEPPRPASPPEAPEPTKKV